MKIEIMFVAVLLMGGTTLLGRILSQGFESALVATAIEWSARRIREAGRILLASINRQTAAPRCGELRLKRTIAYVIGS